MSCQVADSLGLFKVCACTQMGQIAKPTATEIAVMNMRHFGKLSRLEERVGFSHDLGGTEAWGDHHE